MRNGMAMPFLGLLCLVCRVVSAEGEPPPARVILRGGCALYGKVAGEETLGGKTFWKIKTDFGRIIVPKKELRKREGATKGTKDATFVATEVRLLRLRGGVLRRARGQKAWIRLSGDGGSTQEAEKKAATGPVPPRLTPGDGIRTEADGTVEILLHRDVWVQVGPASEVEIAATPARGATLSLLRGRTAQRVEGRPRGEVFRLRTPSVVIGVKGTLFLVEVAERESVTAAKGTVTVGTLGDVSAGETGTWEAGGTFERRAATESERAALDLPPVRYPADDMVYVPGGEYRIGGGLPGADAPDAMTTASSYSAELRVRVRPFLIDRHEVTNGDFAAYASFHPGDRSFGPVRSAAEEARLPVSGISLLSAEAFAGWLGKRVPTNAQWEIAARGPDCLVFPWGNRIPKKLKEPLRRLGITMDRWNPPKSLVSVDEPTPDVSAFGVQAMVTSVVEWTRTRVGDEALYPILSFAESLQGNIEKEKHRDDFLYRGYGGSTRTLTPAPANALAAGFRCVVELP